MTLELDGHQVTVASNGREAMRLIDQHAFELIVLDLVMPVMDGVCFIRWLREEKASTIPVLIMSGVARDGMVEELKNSGASDVVCKPIDTATFLAQVHRLL
jgi:DNA-binding response OmpR family regulator